MWHIGIWDIIYIYIKYKKDAKEISQLLISKHLTSMLSLSTLWSFFFEYQSKQRKKLRKGRRPPKSRDLIVYFLLRYRTTKYINFSIAHKGKWFINTSPATSTVHGELQKEKEKVSSDILQIKLDSCTFAVWDDTFHGVKNSRQKCS